jgi:hypothetical protein
MEPTTVKKPIYKKWWFYLGLVVILILGAAMQSKEEQGDFRSVVSYDLHQTSLAQAHAACVTVLRGEQSYKTMTPLKATEIKEINDSIITARFKPSEYIDYKIKCRLSKSGTDLTLYVSASEDKGKNNNTSVEDGKTMASGWGDDILKTLGFSVANSGASSAPAPPASPVPAAPAPAPAAPAPAPVPAPPVH